jgi:hypothetical protein
MSFCIFNQQRHQADGTQNTATSPMLNVSGYLSNHSSMGIFNWFKKPTIIQDDYFGRLRYMDFKDPSKGYFEGKGIFKPYNIEIEYLIEADKSGPTINQREFYKNLEVNFDKYIEAITPLITDEFSNWVEGFEIFDFKKEFELVAVTIPRFTTTPLIWDMSFTTIHDKDHHVTVDFEDDEPKNIMIDG